MGTNRRREIRDVLQFAFVQFLLGFTIVPREIKTMLNRTLRGKQGLLWEWPEKSQEPF